MEYRIGQVFELKGKWYQFVEVNGTCCNNCVLNQGLKCMHPEPPMQCARFFRKDGKNGHVVLLDAIGGEYKQGNAIFRDYRCQTKPVTTDKRVYISNSDSEVGLIVSIRLTSLNGIEQKIGEIFEYDDEYFQCVESSGCALCAFNEADCNDMGCCEVNSRSDGKSVVFKKLEKVGEPFMIGKVLYQHYKAFDIDNVCRRDGFWCIHNYKAKTLTIELTQNKEDMEENNNAKHSNTENIGKNLKPFNLKAAKSGKPVCTRDGKKVRIICFDVKGSTHPIIALIEEGEDERLCSYMPNGSRYEDEKEWKDDLMMLPEKKEGWVNVYKEPEGEYYVDKIIHKTEKFAFDVACPDNYIGTVKIEWYE